MFGFYNILRFAIMLMLHGLDGPNYVNFMLLYKFLVLLYFSIIIRHFYW